MPCLTRGYTLKLIQKISDTFGLVQKSYGSCPLRYFFFLFNQNVAIFASKLSSFYTETQQFLYQNILRVLIGIASLRQFQRVPRRVFGAKNHINYLDFLAFTKSLPYLQVHVCLPFKYMYIDVRH